MATPSDPKEAEELTTIMARLDGMYGKGKWCRDPKDPDTCQNIDDITKVMANVRDPKQLLQAWEGWHTISPPMRKVYARFVELSNKGARELGFVDTGAMWRSKYDMPPDEFTKELDRLWGQVQPLYLKLHAYVRIKLREKYGDVVPANGPIPAYLLGNIWAQEWGNIYPLVAPPNADPGYSSTEILKVGRRAPLTWVRTASGSIRHSDSAPLPKTFWERSLSPDRGSRSGATRARGTSTRGGLHQDVHRADRRGLHDHSSRAGHNYHQRAYKDQPVIFPGQCERRFPRSYRRHRGPLRDAGYLGKIGLLDKAPDASRDLACWMRDAPR